MKKIFTSIFIFLAFLIVTSSSKAQTCWATKSSGSWGDFNIWESYSSYAEAIAATPGSGTASTSTTPSGTHNVLIRSGYTVTMGGGNKGCKSIIIQSGGKLWANETTARRLQIGAGGTGWAYPLTDTVQVDGIMGGQNDGLFIESGSQAQTINISGTGTIDLYRMRMPGGAAGPTTINIDANINLWVAANYALSAIYNPAANDNYTINILTGKTVTTKSADGYFNSASSSYTSYGTYTYNIYGTLDLSANTQTTNNLSVNFIAPAGATTSRVNVNVDGGVLKTGAGIKCDTTSISTGILDFNVVNGGVVDAALATYVRLGKTSDGSGGYYDMFFGVDGTGKVKLTADAVGATFPVGINTGTTKNNCKIVNVGTSDVYSVGLKSTFDNAPVNPTKVVNRQWSIDEATAGGSDDTLRLSWLAADQASAFDPAQPIAIMQWTGSAWQNTNASISGTGVVDDPYVAKASGFTNFSTNQFGVTNLASTPSNPTITSYTPASGCNVSNTFITITGTNFTGATAVTIGGTAAINFVVISSTQITAVVGAGVSGPVVVVTPGGSANAPISFTSSATTTPTFTQVAAICAGGSFTLPTTSNNGVAGSWLPAINNQATTTYTFTPSVGQCATTATMTVTVNAGSNQSTTQTACGSYVWNGTTYTTSGTYTRASGCSVDTLYLTINAVTTNTSSASACTSYTWSANGVTYTSSGVYTKVTGCNTEILNLTINQPQTPSFTQVAAICAGGSFILPTTSINGVSGTWSPANNNQATTTYTFTPSVGQCATTATMTVTVNTGSNQTTTQTACGSYVWNGTTYSASGTYTYATGCSVDTLYLTINAITTNTSSASACTSYTWSANGVTYTASGAYTKVTGCNTEILNLTINQPQTPTFTQVAPICVGGSFSLPTTSINGVSGTWSPANNNQATTTYTFTPSVGQCATTATMTVTVNAGSNQSTTQTACGTYVWNGTTYSTSGTYTRANGCSVDTLYLTINAITTNTSSASACTSYTWSANGVTYTASGAYTKVTGCNTEILNLTINQPQTPTFTQVAPITVGGSFTLPTTSNNGVSGTWAPAINNQATTTYTFTPAAGQCATTATMTVTVNPVTVTPTFTQVDPVCAGSSFVLPTTSNNGITGTWAPAINNQATTTYTFTPATGQSATTATMTVTVNAPIVPTFTQVAPITIGGTFTLPTTSNNSIAGTWTPAVNNQATTVYTFTPTAGLCATTASMTVVVNDTNTTVTPTAVVYPNPTQNGKVTINWANAKIPNNTKVLVVVYDRNGRAVRKEDYLNTGNGITTDFDIKGTSNGLYFIRIQTADKSIKYSTKILKVGK